MKKIRFIYPWLTAISALLLTLYLYSESASGLTLPSEYYGDTPKHIALACFIIILLTDMILFRRKQKHYNQAVDKYVQHVDDILKTKNALQAKAHQYSDHADKLKLFISDRLLEYIEYDEKFLHFKNIASEVRHNGVVCYDKVTSALAQADNTDPENENTQYKDALNSMHYLWDLLDLSTTDNIALYIANKLYEAEELYYQSVLQNHEETPPYTPVFPVRRAIYKALHGFANSADKQLPPLGEQNETYNYQDDIYHIHLEDAGEFLGNENYIVLMAENLINNALFYAGSGKYANKFTRIGIHLSQSDGKAILTLYNHGPHIDESKKQHIFQLGYSTKRSKDHNGKGLGLYFVNEIVKGYEGNIRVDNITDQPDTYVIRLAQENGETHTHIIETRHDDNNRLQCQIPQTGELSKTLSFQTNAKLISLEIAVQSLGKTYTVNNPATTPRFTDPHQPARPQWCLDISHKKSSSKVVFRPLKTAGVEFTIALPTANSRLDTTYHETDPEALQDISELESVTDNILSTRQ